MNRLRNLQCDLSSGLSDPVNTIGHIAIHMVTPVDAIRGLTRHSIRPRPLKSGLHIPIITVQAALALVLALPATRPLA